MNLPMSSKKILDLEADLALTPEDFRAMGQKPPVEDRDLSSYLDFLEEIGAFETRKTDVKIYEEQFEL